MQRGLVDRWSQYDCSSFERCALPDVFGGKIRSPPLPQNTRTLSSRPSGLVSGGGFYAFTDGAAMHPNCLPSHRSAWVAYIVTIDREQRPCHGCSSWAVQQAASGNDCTDKLAKAQLAAPLPGEAAYQAITEAWCSLFKFG
eukprot:3168824-Amphidinium_carterae.1